MPNPQRWNLFKQEQASGELDDYRYVAMRDFGLPMASNRALKVDTPEQSRAMLIGVLENHAGAARDIVIFNSGAALYAANVADTIAAGLAMARDAIESGAAKARLERLVELSHSLAG